jgi:basic membrane protein A and related proteins
MRRTAALALLLSGCWMGPWPGADLSEPSVGFVYVGPVGDHGWTKAHDDGRLYLEDQVDGVTTHYEPSVIAADAPDVMDAFIAEGDNIIFTTSFDYIAQTQNAAANNADVNFLNCSGFYSSANMGSYFGRMYQAWYLAGMVAGYMTLQSGSDRIGVVGPVVIP